ncbi:hypothetical protein [uncultured Rikenella sp.]|uniref:hypothetical protein n=1 Tax=uncultured Rikenella sp. TaxID=368003 RepID=UPI0026286825|nr:hypothetical protein [uncultured Rikenella sp.]
MKKRLIFLCFTLSFEFLSPFAYLSSGPAPGYRERSNGELVGPGGYGYSYSASFNNSHCFWLDFKPTWLNPSHTHGRTHGFQLRCLSE